MILSSIPMSPTHRIARTADELSVMVRCVSAAHERGFDFETDGLRYANGKHPIGYSLGYIDANGAPQCWYVPVAHLTGEQQVPLDVARRAFGDALRGAPFLIGQHVKFDINMGLWNGWEVPHDSGIHDVGVQAHLINENRSAWNLEALVSDENCSPWGDAFAMKNGVEAYLKQRAKDWGLPLKKSNKFLWD